MISPPKGAHLSEAFSLYQFVIYPLTEGTDLNRENLLAFRQTKKISCTTRCLRPMVFLQDDVLFSMQLTHNEAEFALYYCVLFVVKSYS